MPELFPNLPTYVFCALVMAGAQLLYATVGFGAGMFSIALLALVLPDLAKPVAVLLILTFVTELWVLVHAWREARLRLLLGLLPTMAVGLWLGTEVLAAGNVGGLKRGLGAVVAMAGVWFLSRARRGPENDGPLNRLPPGVASPSDASDRAAPARHRGRAWTSLPAGLVSGVLAGMFGTGGPPVIVLLKGYGLDKGAFRATLLWYFLLMSLVRAVTYVRAGLLTGDEALAALWLLPPSVVGILLGMLLHRRLSERHFGTAVSGLLVFLGLLLLIGVGRQA